MIFSMGFEFFIARRYLRAKRKWMFAWVTSLIGVTGVMLGVAVLIATLSVMNGFQEDIQKKIIGAQSHLVIYGPMGEQDRARVESMLGNEPEVVAHSPFVLGQAILTYQGRSIGTVFKGVDLPREFEVSELKGFIQEGSWERLQQSSSGKMQGIVLGEQLALNMGIGVGEQVVLISPKTVATPLGLLPRMQPFEVMGTFKTGYYEYDSSMGYVLLSAAKKFVEDATQMGLEVRLKNLEKAEALSKKFQRELGFAYNVKSYSQMNQTLFAALKLEKFVMFTLLVFIILVASFNIASNLILLSTEKTKDIGLLKAMGMTPQRIWKIFCLEGTLIALAGVGLGVGLGLFASWFIGYYPLVELPPDIYYLSRVPVAVHWGDVLAVSAISLVVCVLATLYPAYRSSRVHPVEAIHYG